MILNNILKIDPTASSEETSKIVKVWEEVVDSIIKEMLAYTKPSMSDLHINLREEMILDLAKLISFLSAKVTNDRMNGRSVKNIDPKIEYEECFNSKGRDKISVTARNCAEEIWLKKYKERWKKKTEVALIKEKNINHAHIIPTRVDKNHFIPKFFIKKYWSEGQFVYRNIKKPKGLEEKIKTPAGSWGFRKNLYSDHLEAYFGLLEGDALRPIQMILNIEPLNRPQREALVGFIIIQRLRNLHFIKSLEKSLLPLITSEPGADKFEDKQYMKTVYETLYRQNDFYDKLARPIIYSHWVIVRSESPDFVLPDVCNIFGNYKNKQYVIMPLTPKDCLIVLPIRTDEPSTVPHYITASESMVRDISFILRCAAKEEFLSKSDASFITVNEALNKVMHRMISSLTKDYR